MCLIRATPCRPNKHAPGQIESEPARHSAGKNRPPPSAPWFGAWSHQTPEIDVRIAVKTPSRHIWCIDVRRCTHLQPIHAQSLQTSRPEKVTDDEGRHGNHEERNEGHAATQMTGDVVCGAAWCMSSSVATEPINQPTKVARCDCSRRTL